MKLVAVLSILAASVLASPFQMVDEAPKFSQVGHYDGLDVDSAAAAQYQTALEQLKQDILEKSRDLREEIDWCKDVEAILAEYQVKLDKVKADIEANRADLKDMLKKRRQVENLILQEQLEEKLKDANNDLSTLTNAIASVQTKSDSFGKNKEEVAATIAELEAQLAVLQGGQPNPAATTDAGAN